MSPSGSAELSTLVKHIHACKVTCVNTGLILNNQARHSSGSSHKNMQHEPLPTDVIRERMQTEEQDHSPSCDMDQTGAPTLPLQVVSDDHTVLCFSPKPVPCCVVKMDMARQTPSGWQFNRHRQG